MKGMRQRLLFLAVSAVMLAVCRNTAPGEKDPVYQPVFRGQGEPASAVQVRGTEENTDQPKNGPAWDTPFYTYCDEAGNLQLELYLDTETGQGFGTRYDWDSWDGQRAVPALYTFSFDSASPDEAWGFLDAWQAPYSVMSVWGTDGSELVEDYQAFWEYDTDGRPVRFRSQGGIDDSNFEAPVRVLEFAFFYREDGSLCRKSYHHEPWLFGTTGSSAEVYYDELERPVFARCYITHGHLEFYYLYTKETPQPDCCLYLDFFSGETSLYAVFHPYE